MKTIEQAAKNYTELRGLAEVFKRSRIADFMAGAEFAQQFISPEEEMPPAQTKVLAKIDVGEGRTWTILAEYIEPRTVLAEDFFEDGNYDEEDMDYDEESDSYFVPETWVECSYFGTSYMFSETVIGWRPINKK